MSKQHPHLEDITLGYLYEYLQGIGLPEREAGVAARTLVKVRDKGWQPRTDTTKPKESSKFIEDIKKHMEETQ